MPHAYCSLLVAQLLIPHRSLCCMYLVRCCRHRGCVPEHAECADFGAEDHANDCCPSDQASPAWLHRWSEDSSMVSWHRPSMILSMVARQQHGEVALLQHGSIEGQKAAASMLKCPCPSFMEPHQYFEKSMHREDPTGGVVPAAPLSRAFFIENKSGRLAIFRRLNWKFHIATRHASLCTAALCTTIVRATNALFAAGVICAREANAVAMLLNLLAAKCQKHAHKYILCAMRAHGAATVCSTMLFYQLFPSALNFSSRMPSQSAHL
eukprot:scaffold113846_cov17-Tisochrysis_lutea.AAC.1